MYNIYESFVWTEIQVAHGAFRHSEDSCVPVKVANLERQVGAVHSADSQVTNPQTDLGTVRRHGRPGKSNQFGIVAHSANNSAALGLCPAIATVGRVETKRA